MNKKIITTALILVALITTIILIGCTSNSNNVITCTSNIDCNNMNCTTGKMPQPMPECVNNTCKCTYSYCKEIGGCD